MGIGPEWIANPIQAALHHGGKKLSGFSFGGDTGLRQFAPNLYNAWFGKPPPPPVDNFDKNARLQREFAQNSIRWKVNDAKMAGIHPIYALGGQGTSFSPMYSSDAQTNPEDQKWAALSEIGQGATRAIAANMSEPQKQMAALQLESAQLDNDIKRVELQRLMTPTPSAPLPAGAQNFIEGQGNSGPANKIVNKPMERVTSLKGRPDLEPGAKTGVGFYVTKEGALIPVPSLDTKQSIEDNLIQETMWSWRNNIMPNFTGGSPPPGYRWSYKQQGYVRDTGKDPKDWKDYGPRKGGR